jgi:uncharacterized protein (DUF1697 family)
VGDDDQDDVRRRDLRGDLRRDLRLALAPLSAFVVFLRGVNVGGNKKFSPAALARDLSHLDVTNVGAAGTFVVRRGKSAAALRKTLAERLPFEAHAAIVPADALVALADDPRFPKDPPGDDVRRMLAVLTGEPEKTPRLPLRRPDGDDWQMRLVRFVPAGPFVLYLWRPDRARMLYTDIVEREFGVPATTRTWNTIEKIRTILGT